MFMHDNFYADESTDTVNTYNPATDIHQHHEDLILRLVESCTDHKGMSVDQIQRTSKRDFRLSRSQVSQAIRRLENEGMLIQNAPGRYSAV